MTEAIPQPSSSENTISHAVIPRGTQTAGVDFVGGSAGSVRAAHTAATTAAPEAVQTAPRHPVRPASAASGSPAANAPNCTPDCFMPVTEPRRAGGTAARIALFVAGLASACGTPPSATAASRNPEPGAVPISASATAATAGRVTRQRRGPTRSTTRPPTGESTAAVANPTVVVSPSTVGETPRSATSRGPSAPSRNNCIIEKAMAHVSSAVRALVAPSPVAEPAPFRPACSVRPVVTDAPPWGGSRVQLPLGSRGLT